MDNDHDKGAEPRDDQRVQKGQQRLPSLGLQFGRAAISHVVIIVVIAVAIKALGVVVLRNSAVTNMMVGDSVISGMIRVMIFALRRTFSR